MIVSLRHLLLGPFLLPQLRRRIRRSAATEVRGLRQTQIDAGSP